MSGILLPGRRFHPRLIILIIPFRNGMPFEIPYQTYMSAHCASQAVDKFKSQQRAAQLPSTMLSLRQAGQRVRCHAAGRSLHSPCRPVLRTKANQRSTRPRQLVDQPGPLSGKVWLIPPPLCRRCSSLIRRQSAWWRGRRWLSPTHTTCARARPAHARPHVQRDWRRHRCPNVPLVGPTWPPPRSSDDPAAHARPPLAPPPMGRE